MIELPESIKVKHNGHYVEMTNDSPFAKRFNECQKQHWEETGEEIDAGSLMLRILIEEYNSWVKA